MRPWILLSASALATRALAEAPEPLPPAAPAPAPLTAPVSTQAPAATPSPASPPVQTPPPAPPPLVPAPPAAKLTGEAQASYLRSSGSSSQETLKGLLDTRYARAAWTHEFKFEVLNETDSLSGRHTRERYLVIEKSSWNFTPRDYLFVRSQYEKDRQSFYDYQAMLTAGYGHQFLKTETLFLSLDAGAGLRHSKDRISRDHDEDVVANTALRFEWKFSPGGRLTENASIEAGEENSIARTRTALHLALTGVMGLLVAFETKHDDSSLAAADTLLTIGLSYRFQ